jgi:sigma-B regulation protein RsbU (phosphoserine phosphatase)
MPSSPRVRIAARYLPMTAVAGDFYDCLVVDDHRMGILVADVSGHGVPAALIASMVKVAIAAQAPHADDPARVLTGMNETLCGKLQGQFVTAAYLYLDFADDRMRYAAAGHPPMLWRRAAERRVEEIEQNGMVLGFFAGAPYSATERAVAPGDRFLLYTDGFLEATNGTDEFYGADRLRASFDRAPSGDPETSVAAIVEELAAWSGRVGADQEDDLTAVCVDILPGSAVRGERTRPRSTESHHG